MLKRLAQEGLLNGNTLGVDSTTLEADAALRSIVRRDNVAGYDEHMRALMKAEGIEETTPAQRQRFDRRRKKSLSNREWVNPNDEEARITKMKDGRTHLAYKAERAVDLETGAVLALTGQPGDCGDTVSMRVTLAEADETVVRVKQEAVERVVADKGYHSKQALRALTQVGVRTMIAEPERKRQRWTGQSAALRAVHANRRRLETKTAKAQMRRRGELIERSFAHLYDTGGMRRRSRRAHLRGKDYIAKRAVLHWAVFDLSLLFQRMVGVGTARQASGLRTALYLAIL